MAITAGSDIRADDFISASAGAGSSGKVAKLDANGKIDNSFLYKNFGEGSDGNHTVSGTETLTRDMFYNNLTITTSQVLITGGFLIFVKGTISGGGTIKYTDGNTGSNGGNGSGITGGGGGAGGTVTTGGRFSTNIGGQGARGGDRFAGGGAVPSVPVPSNSIGVSNASSIGATGAGGSSGGGSGGAAGAIPTSPIINLGVISYLTLVGLDLNLTPSMVHFKSSGGGGGGGAGGGGQSPDGAGGGGGGGGASGGIVYIIANIWAGTFTIQAKGGNGGNGGTQNGPGGQGGGGAGGAGGVSVMIYDSKTWTGSYVLTGGTGGTGSATGNTGVTGTSYEIQIGSLNQ